MGGVRRVQSAARAARAAPLGVVAVWVVGLTGGIGSGKTTAAAVLRGLGAPVLSSDDLAREVVAPGEPVRDAIVEAFGPGILRPDGTLDRRALAAVVFGDPAARARLEALTHPEIRRRTLWWLDERRREGARAAVCDIPLLFEVGLHLPGTFVDRVWVVAVRPEVQFARLLSRDGGDPEAARARIAAQWPIEAKVRLADRVFDNNGVPERLEAEVARAWTDLMAEAAPGHGAAD